MNEKIVIISLVVLLIASCLDAQEAMSDEEFERLLDRIPSNYRTVYYDIAYSGHPDGLDVLRNLWGAYEISKSRKWTWADFKKENGYPSRIGGRGDSAIEGWPSISTSPIDLENALAAAGDEEAFERIIQGFDSKNSDEKYKTMRRMVKLRTNRSINFLAALLDRTDELADVFPVSFRAAEALHDIVEDRGAPSPSKWEFTPEGFDEISRVWRTWWRDHAHEYGEGVSSALLSATHSKSESPTRDEPIDVNELGTDFTEEEGFPLVLVLGLVAFAVIVTGVIFKRGNK